MSAATRARLAELVAAGDMDLAEANLLIAAEASPRLDAAAVLAEVDALADAARDQGVVPALRDRGFRGDGDDYDDPRNSFLDQVLRRRRGLPIALATLTLAVARRVGHPMAGIGMPGHFVVADLSGSEPVHLDPFDGWRALSTEDLARIVRETTGLGAARRLPGARLRAGDPHEGRSPTCAPPTCGGGGWRTPSGRWSWACW